MIEKFTRHERLLKLAYQASFRSNYTKFPIAAVLARGNYVISIGINSRTKTHPKQKLRSNPENGSTYGDHHIHAELDCLIRASYEEIKGASIYIVRRRRDIRYGLAKPCEVCMQELIHYGIKRAYFTTDNNLSSPGYEIIELK